MNSFITQSKQMPGIGLAVTLLVLGLLAACKPKVEPIACTPLPIVDGFETAMTEGGKMRLRLPKHASRLTNDCKQIKWAVLDYYWHNGKLIKRDAENQFDGSIPQSSQKQVVEIYLREFKLLSEVAPITLKPWQFEGAVRHYKYPLEFYPKFYWTGADQPSVKEHPNKVWGVVGTRNPITKLPFTTLCGIIPSGNEPQTNLVNGDFPNDTPASCRGGLAVVKGDKVAFGLFDVWSNNARDIDKIYNAAIAEIQTYIQE